MNTPIRTPTPNTAASRPGSPATPSAPGRLPGAAPSTPGSAIPSRPAPGAPPIPSRMAVPRSIPLGGAPGSGATPSAGSSPSAGSIAASDAQFLRELVLDRSAIVLDPSKEYLLTTRLEPIARAERLPDLAALVDQLRRAPRGRLEMLVIDAMTTNETSFFRDVHPFQVFADVLVPEILNSSQTLTMWCGASSSGQEPYTILLSLVDRHPDLLRGGRLAWSRRTCRRRWSPVPKRGATRSSR